ncbi:LOW QUALITY PROTEIN: hypothetical protein ACHAXS_000577 [Conticribra weissflogii]
MESLKKEFELSQKQLKLCSFMLKDTECVDTMLWPFAVKAAIDRLNNLQINLNGSTLNSKFFGTGDQPVNVENYHVFGCPVYVLDSCLQSGTIGPPKWEPRSQLAYILGIHQCMPGQLHSF